MKLNSQIKAVFIDPIVYYEYYYNKYTVTNDLFEKMIANGYNINELIDIRAALSECAGRFSIARGVLADIPEMVLTEYWNGIDRLKTGIGYDLDKLIAFEKYVDVISEKCRRAI